MSAIYFEIQADDARRAAERNIFGVFDVDEQAGR